MSRLHLILFAILCVLIIQEAKSADKTEEFLKKKFANYDKTLRPNFGGKPVVVTVSSIILDISSIDEVKQDLTVNMILRHEWKDPQLEYTAAEAGTDEITLIEDYSSRLWRPDTFIVNERASQSHDLFTDNQYVRLFPDGNVMISNRFSVKMSCRLDLGWFPFDRHLCPIVIESYGHNTNDLIYQWRNDSGGEKPAVRVSKGKTLSKFSIAGVNTRKEEVKLSTGGYMRLALEFFMIRASARFIQEIYFPAILITLISFITLFNEVGGSKIRLQLSMLLEGVMIILISLTGRIIPPVGYQTALDFYLVTCLVTTSCVVLVNFIICLMLNNIPETNGVTRLRPGNEESLRDEEGKELFSAGSAFAPANRFVTLLIKFRFAIPLFFVGFNLLYWLVVLIGSSFYPADFLIFEKIMN